MLKVAISGAAGRMGRRLAAIVSEQKDMQVAAAIDSADSPFQKKDSGLLAGISENKVLITASLGRKFDVLIDFSSPEGTAARIDECVKTKTPIVIGTTGLTDEVLAKAHKASAKIPVLVSPNMSVGMNALFNTVGKLAATLGDDYDIEIVEAHHKHKKDAPSGTAVKLAQEICGALGKNLSDNALYGRKGQVGERQKGEIGIFAVRGGDIVGEHRVLYVADGETIEVIHRAHSRDTFVRGAVRAARFIANAKKGLYSMKDVLRINN
ncbi:MAG: 4-hydroxy-tetrahydrodipicolinate reductase [Planctomycetes bacterium]|nr:4-hydroxy-tetrahydrodipicolinate reductase [Planctomycetota bacterium]